MAGNGSDEDDNSGPLPEEGQPDVESLRVTRDEARAVLDKQIDTLNHLDSKAAETLRLNIVILGVLLTISSLFVGSEATPDIGRFVNLSIAVGVVFTFFSIIFSFWTYTSTRKETGPGPNDIRRLANHEYDEKRWLSILVRTYSHWMERNDKENKRDSITLFFGHVFLFSALGYYTFGILWGLLFHNQSWLLLGIVLLFLLVLLPIVVTLPRIPVVDGVRRRVWNRTEEYWDRLYE